MSEPIVSIIVPTFNRAALLPRALDSILAQTMNDWEIVLVDDGSTDDTTTVAQEYARRLGDRFRYLRQAHAGVSAARNRGIDACRGRYVAFLDSDDEYFPAKLERQLALFAIRPELGLVYGDYAYVDGSGVRHESVWDSKTTMARRAAHQIVAPGLCVCGSDLFDWLLREYFIATIVGMVRREVLADAIRFPAPLSYAEEWLFYLQVARVCPAGYVDEPLCLHHHVPGSLSRTNRQRNTRRLYDLLTTMCDILEPLAPRQGRILDRHCALICRQLGYDTYRDRRYRQALHHFARSFRHVPSLRGLVDLVHCALRFLGPVAADTPSAVSLAQE